MLGRKYRLTKRGSFNFVYRKGKFIGGRNISLVFTSGKDVPRIGFSVSNKIGHAVVRNKLKRRMRAIIGKSLAVIKPCQAVFTTKEGAGAMSYAEIENEIAVLLTKSGLRKISDVEEEN